VDEELVSRQELTATLFAIADAQTSERSGAYSRRSMAKPRKMSPEELAERRKREREFRELLERRRRRDAELEAARNRRSS
jgi:hypothetical protein